MTDPRPGPHHGADEEPPVPDAEHPAPDFPDAPAREPELQRPDEREVGDEDEQLPAW